ncbi:STN domain-containing protein [Stutzerimonas kirkiae]|uniref:STN domain-containing protein n=1 Tax=Stutzerimonas kirkiae TaxID=2211392 RepID=UPI0031017382
MPYDPALMRGKQAPGLDGHYQVDSALEHLLAGSGLVASRGASGNWVLEVRPSLDSLELSAVSISGKAPGSITEGTGSYTTWSSSSSTRLNLSLQEIPQSITVLTRQRLDDQRLDNLIDVLEATAGITVIKESLARTPTRSGHAASPSPTSRSTVFPPPLPWPTTFTTRPSTTGARSSGAAPAWSAAWVPLRRPST